MMGFKADRLIVVGDGLLIAFQLRGGPGALEIEPGTVRIEANVVSAIGDGFLEPLPIGVVQTGAGPAWRTAGVVLRENVT